ncbi:MAG: hypothetical protein D6830_03765 [Ignavibacteria bacterium]|nr:MAG: hypothetical protein D6830_03765 [Ignavibacteria bacterium]
MKRAMLLAFLLLVAPLCFAQVAPGDYPATMPIIFYAENSGNFNLASRTPDPTQDDQYMAFCNAAVQKGMTPQELLRAFWMYIASQNSSSDTVLSDPATIVVAYYQSGLRDLVNAALAGEVLPQNTSLEPFIQLVRGSSSASERQPMDMEYVSSTILCGPCPKGQKGTFPCGTECVVDCQPPKKDCLTVDVKPNHFLYLPY